MMALPPATFWRMPVAEWLLALQGFSELHGGSRGGEPLSRAELGALMRQFPDRGGRD